MAAKNKTKFAAFALHLGLLTHIGNYDSVADANDAAVAWREDPNFNRMGVMTFIIEFIETDAA